ncbi:hypothetical protein NDU88_005400 [Pleurodeles waltl]|uniref:Uncharacterized protein n=1 Tax=Pleurodeles waltl TaxID=8319 RepID=A0AAV7WBP7_PLEWA|nr:hypothetical protein NDU88_005400 [Pleurodeles waltl]
MRRHSSRAIQQPKNVHAEGTQARHAHRCYRRREHKLVSRSGATGGRETNLQARCNKIYLVGGCAMIAAIDQLLVWYSFAPAGVSDSEHGWNQNGMNGALAILGNNIPSLRTLSILRPVRALRPLRIISRWEGMRVMRL